MTFNGIHLSESGYQVVSQMMAKQLGLLEGLTASQANGNSSEVDAFRRLVYEKNYWHQLWWHAPNASYIHGRRNDIQGAKHLGRERKQSLQLVEDMDERIWGSEKPQATDLWLLPR